MTDKERIKELESEVADLKRRLAVSGDPVQALQNSLDPDELKAYYDYVERVKRQEELAKQ